MTAAAPLIDLALSPALTAPALRAACSENGFFLVANHGVSPELERRLEILSANFFAWDEARKLEIAMARGGRAWRGYFPVGGELTSGKKDLKEGLYFGQELAAGDPRPLHGPNLFPDLPGSKETVLEYMAEMTNLGHRLMGLLSLSLGLPEDYFLRHYTQDPTLLFRIFHYPPQSSHDAAEYPWGVGAHTDYGILTILKQDMVGGLEVQTRQGWVAVPPVPDTFVCNIGDMLDFLTRGLYRSAPHRVRNLSGRERYSWPFFFDPNFAALVRPLPLAPQTHARQSRWDHQDLYAFDGSYGDYLVGKVAKVFPVLATQAIRLK